MLGHSYHAQAMQVQKVMMFGYYPTSRTIQGPFDSYESTEALSQHTGDQTKSRTFDQPDPETSQGAALAEWLPNPTRH